MHLRTGFHIAAPKKLACSGSEGTCSSAPPKSLVHPASLSAGDRVGTRRPFAARRSTVQGRGTLKIRTDHRYFDMNELLPCSRSAMPWLGIRKHRQSSKLCTNAQGTRGTTFTASSARQCLSQCMRFLVRKQREHSWDHLHGVQHEALAGPPSRRPARFDIKTQC
jgi:hypothetical protein